MGFAIKLRALERGDWASRLYERSHNHAKLHLRCGRLLTLLVMQRLSCKAFLRHLGSFVLAWAHSLKFRCEAQDSLPDPDTLWQPWRLESLGINSLCVFPQTLSAKHEHPQKKKRKTPNGPRHPGSKHTWELHKVPRMPALFGGCGELSKSE